MATKLGKNGAGKPSGKAPKPKPIKQIEMQEWNDENVAKDIKDQITIILNGRNNYVTLAKIAAKYQMTLRNFQIKCVENPEIANLLDIFNGIYLEHIMNTAIKNGKMNSQTEDYLRNETQAYVGSGQEQHITWIINDKKATDITGKELEIVADKDIDEDSDIMFEINEDNNENDK